MNNINNNNNDKENTIDRKKYRPIRQNQVTDNISRGLLDIKEIDELNNAKTTFYNTTTKFELVIENYTSLKNMISKKLYLQGRVNQSAAKLLDCLLIKMTETAFSSLMVELPIKEYAEMLNKKDIKELRKRTKVDLQILKRVKFQSIDNKNNYLKAYLFDGTEGIVEGKIVFSFNKDFIKIFEKQRYFLYLPLEVLQNNERQFPHSYLIFKKIISHTRINANKPNENIISVSELYDYCSTLPRYTAVKETGGAITQRIIEPFETALDSISCIMWNYIDYTPKENGYENFADWYNRKISINWKENFVGKDSIIKGKQKYKKIREKAKIKAIKEIEKNKLKKKNKEGSN